MAQSEGKEAGRRVRAIKTKRDFEAATVVVKKIAEKSSRDAVAEQRMQQLLKELDRADDLEEDINDSDVVDDDYPGPGRRWSDLTSD